jgi:phage terminase small subunit
MDISDKFKDLVRDVEPEVADYMLSVMKCLIDDFGGIEDSFYISLKFIRDNYIIYNTAMKALRSEGLLRKDSHGRTFKNQNWSIAKDAERAISDLLKSFACTPMSKSKMKNLDARGAQNANFSTDSYLRELVGIE